MLNVYEVWGTVKAAWPSTHLSCGTHLSFPWVGCFESPPIEPSQHIQLSSDNFPSTLVANCVRLNSPLICPMVLLYPFRELGASSLHLLNLRSISNFPRTTFLQPWKRIVSVLIAHFSVL
ncbi:hypothetical protein J6590_012217 [Homalodisca vitripennis]|nr:hypothetical protein J6590_012217 [Homalodisca vitripennis]